MSNLFSFIVFKRYNEIKSYNVFFFVTYSIVYIDDTTNISFDV